jgi:hypothetical protein
MFGCGLPVAAKGFPALPELVKDGINGMIFNTSEELVTLILGDVMNDIQRFIRIKFQFNSILIPSTVLIFSRPSYKVDAEISCLKIHVFLLVFQVSQIFGWFKDFPTTRYERRRRPFCTHLERFRTDRWVSHWRAVALPLFQQQ